MIAVEKVCKEAIANFSFAKHFFKSDTSIFREYSTAMYRQSEFLRPIAIVDQ